MGHQALFYTNTSTSLASLSSAVISFWMYHDNQYISSEDQVQVGVSTNGTGFYLQGSPIQRYAATAGWAYHQVDISAFAGPGKPAVYIGFMGTSGYGNDIHIDNIALNSPACQMSGGGMVAGYVTSSPGGLPIISAQVASTARPIRINLQRIPRGRSLPA